MDIHNANPAAIWRMVVSEIDEQRQNYLLGQVKPVEINEDSLILSVPAESVRSLLQERYLDKIEEVMSRRLERPIEVKVLVDRSEISHGGSSTEALQSQPMESSRSASMVDNSSNLNSRYTFDRFVVGTSNRIAYEGAMAVAENPDGRTYNPLFIYGGVGLGKTHLLQAIGNFVVQRNRHMKVLYVTSEMFMNDMIDSIANKKALGFREKYRTPDILLLDDIQFLERKDGTQEEFFNTFNDLYNANKQIVLGSDTRPSQIASIPDRLKSRFQMGLVTHIRPPEFETRVAILRKKKEDLEIANLPDEVIFLIAETIKTNIRELEGALLNVASYASFRDSEITLEIAQEVLQDISEPESVERVEPITMIDIQKTVASSFKISVADLKSSKRNKSIAWPRHIAMYLCRQLTNASLEDIGHNFGGRDHSTVLHAINKIEEIIQSDKDTDRVVSQLTEILKGRNGNS